MIFNNDTTPRYILAGLIWLLPSFGNNVAAEDYSLRQAIQNAQTNDPWLKGSQYRQEQLQSMGVSAGTLPDPSFNLGLVNAPLDSLDFGPESMTQLKAGFSQTFSRGQTLSLRQEKLEKLSQIQPFARENRKAQVAVLVSHLWLEAFRSQKTIALIEHDRELFEYLVEIAQSSYTSVSGRIRQQDIVRAQLELTRLEDRLTVLQQQGEMQLAKLGEWLGYDQYGLNIKMNSGFEQTTAIPNLIGAPQNSQKRRRLAEVINQHPKILSINQKIDAGEAGINLAKQSHKPQWGLNASYGIRGNNPEGDNRSDLISVGLNVTLPLFTHTHHDKHVQAARADKEAIKTERALTLRQLMSGFDTAEVQYLRLNNRKTLFDTRLLKETSEQAEASLAAYTNDNGDFTEVVHARIGELNAIIDALNIDIDIQKSLAQINYFLVAQTTTAFNAHAFPNIQNAVAGDTNE